MEQLMKTVLQAVRGSVYARMPARLVSAQMSWLKGFSTAHVGIMMTILKAYLLVFVAILLRWTTPRVRIDQLLDLGWKFLLPLALVNLLVTAALKLAFPVAFGG